jgi:CheY-like chemotaxis protein
MTMTPMEAMTRAAAPTARRRVLVVDDNDDLRESLAVVLEFLGCEVATAPDGAEALRSLRGASELPCLIVLDLMMPVMNGWEFRAQQLRDPALRGVPVALLTGYAEARDAAADLQAAAVLPKPATVDGIRALVTRFCSA